jgi:hypothetical protein
LGSTVSPAPRFKLTPPVIPEQELHEIVAALLQRLIAPPAEWAFYPAGAIPLSAAQQAKLSRMGLRRGWPDFLILHEWLYGIELKRRGGTLSRTRLVRTKRGSPRILDGQADVFPRLIAAGMRDIAVCHSIGEVVAAFERWRIPLRGRIAA